eukprot:m.699868 g.699868  ORF g.699868 m.699868 type:complete len:438 (+) comp58695_c0_seq1:2145-3458(+)
MCTAAVVLVALVVRFLSFAPSVLLFLLPSISLYSFLQFLLIPNLESDCSVFSSPSVMLALLQGTAFTFITPDQGNYVGDIIRALELSEVTVPAELNALSKKSKEERKQLGIEKEQTGGFGGKGFRFTAEEAAAKKEAERAKTIQGHGLQEELGVTVDDSKDSDDENGDNDVEKEYAKRDKELASDVDSQIDRMMAKALKPSSASKVGATLSALTNTPTTTAAIAPAPDVNVAAMDEAQRRAQEIAKKIKEKFAAAPVPAPVATPTPASSSDYSAQNATAAILGGGTIALSKAADAAARAAAINKKLGIVENKAEVAAAAAQQAALEARIDQELEINDFPQQARWRVTRRETISDLSDLANVALTVRGTYYAPGAAVPDGDRKLYLVIEGTPSDIQKALNEIRRMLREELVAEATTYNPAQRLLNPGKYTVLSLTSGR